MDLLYKALNFLGGASFVLVAVISYFSKLHFERFKREQDILIRKLQAELDKSNSELRSRFEKINHVSKVQFDKEFSIYHEIWSAMFEARDVVAKLRPAFDRFDINEKESDRQRRRLNDFYVKYNVLISAIESYKPFYYEGIYSLACEFRDVCRKEAMEYEWCDERRKPREYWDSRDKNMSDIHSIFEACSDAIRKRIYSLSVIE